MSFSLADILKLLPKAEIEATIDSIVDEEVAKLAVELKVLVKDAVNKVIPS